MAWIPNCDVCGGFIEQDETVVQVMVGDYNRSPGWFGKRVKPPRARSIVHRDCIDGFDGEDRGIECRDMADYLADDSSLNSGGTGE